MTTETFDQLGLREEILTGIKRMGFTQPTPVQTQVISHGRGKDQIVQARTGSGKTVAFGCSTLEEIHVGIRKPVVLVVCPTRELASQVAEELSILSDSLDLRQAVLVGGSSYAIQRSALNRGAAVLVGTPGRILQHIRERTFDSKEIEIVVLDEADRLLDMGFRDELENIMHSCQHRSRTLLFSATIPNAVRFMAERHTKNAIELTVDALDEAHQDITHFAFLVSGTNRFDSLINILHFHEPHRAIVFGNTRRETSALYDRMNQAGFKVGLMSGEMHQKKRDKTMDRFRKGHLQYLVATDVAARGIDVRDIDHVFHYRIPQDSDTYVHRSGRTGRAGRKGRSIVMFSGMEVRDLEKMIKKLPMKFSFLKVPTAQSFEDSDMAVPSGLIAGLDDRLTFELGHAERQVPGLRRLLDAWLQSGLVQPALQISDKKEKTESKQTKKNKWILPVTDLRKGGGGPHK